MSDSDIRGSISSTLHKYSFSFTFLASDVCCVDMGKVKVQYNVQM